MLFLLMFIKKVFLTKTKVLWSLYNKFKMKGLDVANTKVKNIKNIYFIITYIERITFFHGNNKNDIFYLISLCLKIFQGKNQNFEVKSKNVKGNNKIYFLVYY